MKSTIKWLFRVINVFLNLDFIENCRKLYRKSRLGFYGQGVDIHKYVIFKEPKYIRIGNNVSIASFVHIWGKGGVYIGNRVLIGSHTAIVSQTHDYNKIDMYSSHVMAPVTIEDDVWIGSHCILLPGVTISRGSVIGAGSIVTKSTEPDGIYIGTPARLLKKRK